MLLLAVALQSAQAVRIVGKAPKEKFLEVDARIKDNGDVCANHKKILEYANPSFAVPDNQLAEMEEWVPSVMTC